MANRDNSDPSGLGCTLGWGLGVASSTVAYSTAVLRLDINGNPWDPNTGMLIQWNGSKLERATMWPDYRHTPRRVRRRGSVHHVCRKVMGRLFASQTKWRKWSSARSTTSQLKRRNGH